MIKRASYKKDDKAGLFSMVFQMKYILTSILTSLDDSIFDVISTNIVQIYSLISKLYKYSLQMLYNNIRRLI